MAILDPSPHDPRARLSAAMREQETIRHQLIAASAELNRRRWLRDPCLWVEERLGESTWSKQRQVLESVRDNRLTAVQSCHNSGKGLSLDTRLPTPTGWTTMGEVRVGEVLLDERGAPCTVMGVTETWHRPCYRVEFSDGAEIVTDDTHLWSSLRLDERHSTRERRRQRGDAAPSDWRQHWGLATTVSTEQMAEDLLTPSGQLRHAVPLCAPLQGVHEELPIHPYVLGAWLGDGTSTAPEITCAEEDREIVDRMATLGENLKQRSKTIQWSLAGENPRGRLSARLRDLGVLGDKHIPMSYLRATENHRLELLRGIMDTDGFVNPTNGGSVGIDLKPGRLADDVAALIRSLGISVYPRRSTVRCNGTICERVRMTFTPRVCVFHLRRKAAAQTPGLATVGSRSSLRTVCAVTPVPSVPTRCIQVSSPSALYLATDYLIPTHNSWLAARAAAWWIDVHPPGEAFVVTTATTAEQVRVVLWREISRAHAKGKLAGRMNQTEWLITMPAGNEEPVAIGRKPQDLNPTAFHGVHARYVLVIFDEATGVHEALWDAADSLISNAESHFLAVANPDDPLSRMAKVCKPGSGWHVVKISALETPNFTGEQVSTEIKPFLVSQVWVEEKKKVWGETNPMYIAKVLGEFPEYSVDSLIPLAWIRAAQSRWRGDDMPANPNPVSVLGMDVGGGSDRNVFAHRYGRRVSVIKEDQEPDTMKSLSNLQRYLLETRAGVAHVDYIGIGRGVVDRAKQLKLPVVGVNVGEKALDDKAFYNKRAEAYWHLRDLFQADAIDIDPDDEDLAAQLLDIRYDSASGRILLESKETMKRRGKRSPDRADAVMLACLEATAKARMNKATWGRR